MTSAMGDMANLDIQLVGRFPQPMRQLIAADSF